MGPTSAPLSRRGALVLASGATLTLAGCVANPFSQNDGWGSRGAAQAVDVPPPGAGAMSGDVIGNGQTRIGLILPMTATGNAGNVGRAMRQAAELAFGDVPNNDLSILVRDDGGNTQGAQDAARDLLANGVQLVLGPVFAQNVLAAGQVLRPANIPIIAFSTDESVAAQGVNLLSFLPSNDVNRMVEYCSTQGRRSFVALFPDDAYGQLVEAALQSALPRYGARAIALERYPLDRVRLGEPVQRVVPALAQADVLFLPDGADGASLVVEALRNARGALQRVKLAGTGRWNDTRIFNNAAFAGAWFTGPDTAGFRNFAGRFRERFNADPERTASLAYDATLLAAALSAQGARGTATPGGRFGPQSLGNPNGFAGVDGLFRFLPNGQNQRGLAVLEVRNRQPVPISPAPTTFAASA